MKDYIQAALELGLAGGRPDAAVCSGLAAQVAELDSRALPRLMEAGRELASARFAKRVSLCAIVNAKSGRCGENCAFCAQSGHHAAKAPVHGFLRLEEIIAAAQKMRAYGAARFGIVSSGLALNDSDFAKLLAAVAEVSKLGLKADASCGLLSKERLAELKKAGLAAYHHNLETSREFFPNICSTHEYEQDVDSARKAKQEGFQLCSGGIFGLGESWADRLSLALTLRDIGADSVPVNFLRPIEGTPLAGRPKLSKDEALKIIAFLRLVLPQAQIRICGGRDYIFEPDERLLPLAAGASGIMIGDYLTIKGASLEQDREGLDKLGYTVSLDA